MKHSESMEMYLETIFLLRKKKGNVRAIDVSVELGYSKPSVSVAMKNLKENGYLVISEMGHIVLSDKGEKVARETYEKHQILTKLLIGIGMPEAMAEENACRMEHVASMDLIEVIKHSLARGTFSELHGHPN